MDHEGGSLASCEESGSSAAPGLKFLMNWKLDSYIFPLRSSRLLLGIQFKNILDLKILECKLSWYVNDIFTLQSLGLLGWMEQSWTIHICRTAKIETKRTFSPPKDRWQKAGSSLTDFNNPHMKFLDTVTYCTWLAGLQVQLLLGRSWRSFLTHCTTAEDRLVPMPQQRNQHNFDSKIATLSEKSLTTKWEIKSTQLIPHHAPLKIQHLTSLVMNKQDQQPNHIANSSHLGKQKESGGRSHNNTGMEYNRAVRKNISVNWYLPVGPVVKIPPNGGYWVWWSGQNQIPPVTTKSKHAAIKTGTAKMNK